MNFDYFSNSIVETMTPFRHFSKRANQTLDLPGLNMKNISRTDFSD